MPRAVREMRLADDELSSAPANSPGSLDGEGHFVQFYEDDERLCETVARFLGNGLQAGDSLVAIMTKTHRASVSHRLTSIGQDVEGACAAGQLTFLDAHEVLSPFMVGDMPEGEQFKAVVGGVFEKVAARGRAVRIRAYGEMVDV